MIPKIVNHNKVVIETDPNRDDTWLAVETISGMVCRAFQRIFMNFYVKKDLLFRNMQNDTIIPLAFVQRDSVITPT